MIGGSLMARSFALVLCLWMAVPAIGWGGELEERSRIIARSAEMYQLGRFEPLERLAREYRSQKSRTGSGVWKLTWLYAGIPWYPPHGARDQLYWDTVEIKSKHWIERYPDSPTAHIAYAGTLLAHGSSIRGESWARDVQPENWAPYLAYVAKARRYLELHKDIAADDPHWYVLMLSVARHEGWSRPDFYELLQEASARHPSYYPIYFEAADYLLPKWHGDRAQLDRLVELAVSRTKEREGMTLYARVYWYLAQVEYGDTMFDHSLIEWDLMEQGIDEILSHYPDQWNINHFAKFACLAGDLDKARELLARMEGKPLVQAWGDWGGFPMCDAMAHGRPVPPPPQLPSPPPPAAPAARPPRTPDPLPAGAVPATI